MRGCSRLKAIPEGFAVPESALEYRRYYLNRIITRYPFAAGATSTKTGNLAIYLYGRPAIQKKVAGG